MTKDVMISLYGTQSNMGETQAEETSKFIPGCCYEKNGSCYVIFEEWIEGVEEPVKTRVKFGDACFELVRSGPINVRMLFEENKRNMTSYITPYGNIMLGINTKKIHISHETDKITVNMDYVLDAENEYLSDCSMRMEILTVVT